MQGDFGGVWRVTVGTVPFGIRNRIPTSSLRSSSE